MHIHKKRCEREKRVQSEIKKDKLKSKKNMNSLHLKKKNYT